MDKNDSKAILYGCIAVFSWSTVASVFKISLRYISPEELLLYSTVFCSVLLYFILLVQKKGHLLVRITGKQFRMGLICGLLNPVLYYLILLNSYDMLPAQQAQVINYTWAITLSILSVVFLKQKINLLQGAAILVSYLGVVIIATGGKFAAIENTTGVGLALLSTIIWAMYWIINTRDDRDPVVGLWMNFVCGIPFILLYIFFHKTEVHFSLPGMLGGLYVGCFEMGLAFICWLMAMKYAENTVRIANLIFLSPILSLVFIHFFVEENIEKTTIYGLVCIIAGLMIQTKAKEKMNT